MNETDSKGFRNTKNTKLTQRTQSNFYSLPILRVFRASVALIHTQWEETIFGRVDCHGGTECTELYSDFFFVLFRASVAIKSSIIQNTNLLIPSFILPKFNIKPTLQPEHFK